MGRVEGISRRSFLAKSGTVLGTAALAPLLPQRVLSRVGGGFWLPAALASPNVVMDPTNPTNFNQDGGQTVTPGSVLTITDAAISDFATLWAPNPNASAGTTLDVIATFQMTSTIPAGADNDNRLVINDGSSRAAIASCTVLSGTRGMGLLSHGLPTDSGSYPVFVPVAQAAILPRGTVLLDFVARICEHRL